jgi:chromosome segregation ATPase
MDYKQLYEQVQAAFQELQTEYEELKETSKMLEEELEDQIKCMEVAMEEQQTQADQAILKLKEKCVMKETEAQNLEKMLEKNKLELNEAKDKLARLQKLKVSAENENESLEAQVRCKEIKIIELQSELDSSLEKYTILQEESNSLRESKEAEISDLRSVLGRYKEELEFTQRKGASEGSSRLSEKQKQAPQSLVELSSTARLER